MVYMKRGKYLERLPCCTPEEQAAGSVSCFHFHLCNHTLQRFLLRSLLKKKRRIKLTNNYQMSSYHITTFAAVRYSSNCGQNLFSFFLFFFVLDEFIYEHLLWARWIMILVDENWSPWTSNHLMWQSLGSSWGLQLWKYSKVKQQKMNISESRCQLAKSVTCTLPPKADSKSMQSIPTFGQMPITSSTAHCLIDWGSRLKWNS